MTRENVVKIDGNSLIIDQVVAVARGDEDGNYPEVIIDESTEEKIREFRAAIEAKIASEKMYGINTGCGSNKDTIITRSNQPIYPLVV